MKMQKVKVNGPTFRHDILTDHKIDVSKPAFDKAGKKGLTFEVPVSKYWNELILAGELSFVGPVLSDEEKAEAKEKAEAEAKEKEVTKDEKK